MNIPKGILIEQHKPNNSFLISRPNLNKNKNLEKKATRLGLERELIAFAFHGHGLHRVLSPLHLRHLPVRSPTAIFLELLSIQYLHTLSRHTKENESMCYYFGVLHGFVHTKNKASCFSRSVYSIDLPKQRESTQQQIRKFQVDIFIIGRMVPRSEKENKFS